MPRIVTKRSIFDIVTETDVQTFRGKHEGRRYAEVWDGEHEKLATVNQRIDAPNGNWKRATVHWAGGDKSPECARKFAMALQHAADIAAYWNAEEGVN